MFILQCITMNTLIVKNPDVFDASGGIILVLLIENEYFTRCYKVFSFCKEFRRIK